MANNNDDVSNNNNNDKRKSVDNNNKGSDKRRRLETFDLNESIPIGKSLLYGIDQNAPIMTLNDQIRRFTLRDILSNKRKKNWPPNTRELIGEAMLSLDFFQYGRNPTEDDQINFAKLYRIIISTGIEKGSKEDRAKWNSPEVKRILAEKLKKLIIKLRFELLKSGKAINYNGVIVSRKTADRQKKELESKDTEHKRKLRELIGQLDRAHIEWAFEQIVKKVNNPQRLIALIKGDEHDDQPIPIEPDELPDV